MSHHLTIRSVSSLQGEPRALAEKMGLSLDDLVIVKTDLSQRRPSYQIEKIEGDPVSYLIKRAGR